MISNPTPRLADSYVREQVQGENDRYKTKIYRSLSLTRIMILRIMVYEIRSSPVLEEFPSQERITTSVYTCGEADRSNRDKFSSFFLS